MILLKIEVNNAIRECRILPLPDENLINARYAMQRKDKAEVGVITEPLQQEDSAKATSATFLHLDFLSCEFNSIDDLDDNRDNYRSFESLAGIVTSDMRHQQKRKPLKSDLGTVETYEEESDEDESYSEAVVEREKPSSVTILSRGRILIVDTDLKRAIAYAEFLNENGMSCTLCQVGCCKVDCSASMLGSLALVKVDSISISGGFGSFTAIVSKTGVETINLSTLIGQLSSETGHPAEVFDLVLDLQTIPSFSGKRLPLGYYAPGEDKIRIEAALLELPEMRGRFKKPQLSLLLEHRCLHGRSRLKDCSRCLEICPVGAVRTESGKIVLDPYLCQGCGACALVCPADAIQLLNPSQEELLSELVEALSKAVARQDAANMNKTLPDVYLYDGRIEESSFKHSLTSPTDKNIYFGIEEIGRVGLDMLLVALAYGAGSITLVCDSHRPVETQDALRQQAELGSTILQELQMEPDCLRFLIWSQTSDENRLESGSKEHGGSVSVGHFSQPAHLDGDFTFEHDKRTLVRLACDHISRGGTKDHAVISLPAGAPFGTITLGDSCSFCMACAGICPSGALKAGGDLPQLSLVESRCHQCGMCAAACPEKCIQLQPRLLCNAQAADIPVVIKEVEPFKCVECGVPFATKAMIDRLLEKLHGHWMYKSPRQIKRLQMCRSCRTQDALMAGDYKL